MICRGVFDRIVDFVDRRLAVKTYDRFACCDKKRRQLWLAHPRLATRYRMNVGTIVEALMLKVRLTRLKKVSDR